MSFRKPCHMPFRKLIPPFTLTDPDLFQITRGCQYKKLTVSRGTTILPRPHNLDVIVRVAVLVESLTP